ncbi:MAG: hypothetical protein RJA54_719 [Pseudomonadota bacterium]
MKKFLYIVLTMLIFLSANTKGSEKEKIIENLKKINSIKFNFTQTTNDITENGNCIIVYPKKMRCLYEEEDKEIVVNDDYLFLINRRENKNYNYNIKDTPLGVMLDKENIIEKEIYFNSKEMNIVGWKIKNYDKSSLEFLMKNISTNINTNEKFEIPK